MRDSDSHGLNSDRRMEFPIWEANSAEKLERMTEERSGVFPCVCLCLCDCGGQVSSCMSPHYLLRQRLSLTLVLTNY